MSQTVEEFVKSNPYPTYQEMEKMLENNIMLYSEYGLFQHKCCKTIYENPHNKEIIIQSGKEIYNLGGIRALSANLSVLKNYSPYSQSFSTEIKGQSMIVEIYFQECCPGWIA